MTLTMIEVGLKLVGYIIGFMWGKKERMEWLAKSSDYLEKKGWQVSRRLLESEEAQNIYLDKKLERLEKEAPKEPERPKVQTVFPAPKTIKDYDVPVIIPVDIEVKTQGHYLTKTGKPLGLTVHYTAGRFAGGRKSAVNTLNSLAKRGLGCMTMDINGVIYRAKNQELDEVAWHAGSSKWQGKTGISRYCMGMEICNGGKLEDDGKTWYGLEIPVKDQNKVEKQTDNQKPGYYHKYTKAQEESLLQFILWQLDVNPEFSVDWVVGHDEIAPGRKSDPGGSLSITMPKLRSLIRSLQG